MSQSSKLVLCHPPQPNTPVEIATNPLEDGHPLSSQKSPRNTTKRHQIARQKRALKRLVAGRDYKKRSENVTQMRYIFFIFHAELQAVPQAETRPSASAAQTRSAG